MTIRYVPAAAAVALVIAAGGFAKFVYTDAHHGNRFGLFAFAGGVVAPVAFVAMQRLRGRWPTALQAAAAGLVGGFVLAWVAATVSFGRPMVVTAALAVIVYGLGAIILPALAVAAALVMLAVTPHS